MGITYYGTQSFELSFVTPKSLFLLHTNVTKPTKSQLQSQAWWQEAASNGDAIVYPKIEGLANTGTEDTTSDTLVGKVFVKAGATSYEITDYSAVAALDRLDDLHGKEFNCYIVDQKDNMLILKSTENPEPLAVKIDVGGAFLNDGTTATNRKFTLSVTSGLKGMRAIPQTFPASALDLPMYAILNVTEKLVSGNFKLYVHIDGDYKSKITDLEVVDFVILDETGAFIKPDSVNEAPLRSGVYEIATSATKGSVGLADLRDQISKGFVTKDMVDIA